jgi:hypothetical protein
MFVLIEKQIPKLHSGILLYVNVDLFYTVCSIFHTNARIPTSSFKESMFLTF